ncbi:MAG: FAD-binding oxidoreductase [Rhodobacter sp.]|uniref:NAD(P)/FAD-dependent oxidoreductase n=1 Tax=Pararhodobacter sp. TaxID=2127056 RepID=UPI002CCBB055|nr:FAD-binding oxidoreductase [Pararhodobacter sp.]MCC0072307.1 FAD-binding oxidoreductase [Rhodobacter sp.]HPD92179.1 FAD-binding oxidoreductase [Pararhodobacter sp.]
MSQATEHRGIVVIGAGIAGASVAAELAAAGQDVLLLERESAPGYHTTGRSAALFTPTYGPPVIRALTRASGPAFLAPPTAERPHPLLRPRKVLFLARPDQAEALAALQAELGAMMLTSARARALLPLLRGDYAVGALLDPDAADIDVEALHRQYLRPLGPALRLKCEVMALSRDGAGWRIDTRAGAIHADLVVNAAGAWADDLAAMAGIERIGLTPKRRTALLVDPPAGLNPDPWPMAVDIDEEFYIKPDAGKLLLSPADETPSPPCDAQPEDLDVAIAIDRIQTAFDLPVRRVAHKWAGLRSFVADKAPVVGHAPDAPGFVWLAGQGGYGIQSAPAMARTAAALTLGRPIPADIADQGVTPQALSPIRKGLRP